MRRIVLKIPEDQLKELDLSGLSDLPFCSSLDWSVGNRERESGFFVYFLVSGELLVYIGKTIHLRSRIYRHHQGGRWAGKMDNKKFDRCFYLEMKSKREMDSWEILFIQNVPTRYNTELHAGSALRRRKSRSRSKRRG